MLLYRKQINSFLLSSLISLFQILRGQTLIFFPPSVFIPNRFGFFRRFCWQNVFPRRPPFQNSLINGWKTDIMRMSGEIDFRFRLKLKITIVESTYPSQRPQRPTLSPHFLLQRHNFGNFGQSEHSLGITILPLFCGCLREKNTHALGALGRYYKYDIVRKITNSSSFNQRCNIATFSGFSWICQIFRHNSSSLTSEIALFKVRKFVFWVTAAFQELVFMKTPIAFVF